MRNYKIVIFVLTAGAAAMVYMNPGLGRSQSDGVRSITAPAGGPEFLRPNAEAVEVPRAEDARRDRANVSGEDWSHVPAAVRRVAPQIFRTIPHQFLPQYKNPCWYRGPHLNCLPYFYLIGMPKCGTTELYDKIAAHPDVVAQVPKEPHWWAHRRLGWTATPIHKKEVLRIRKLTGGKDDSSFEWYLNLYKTYAIPTIQSHSITDDNNHVTYPVVFGDASVSTAWDVHQSELKEDNMRDYSTAELIHAVQPDAKLIMILRNPTDREFSAFFYNGGQSLTKFGAQRERDVSCFRECLKKHSELSCLQKKSCGLFRSLYVVYLEEWLRVFGKASMLVLTLDDWKTDPLGEYQKVLKFLELRDLTPEELNEIISRKPKNVNSRKKSSPMMNSTRAVLDDFFRPYNQRLAKLLGDAKFEFKTT